MGELQNILSGSGGYYKSSAYFDDVTEGKKPAVQLTAEEYEQDINEFDDGIRKIIAEADEMIFRAKLGDLPEALSFSYIAQKYFGKSRGWLMQKVNGNKVNGKMSYFMMILMPSTTCVDSTIGQ